MLVLCLTSASAICNAFATLHNPTGRARVQANCYNFLNLNHFRNNLNHNITESLPEQQGQGEEEEEEALSAFVLKNVQM